LAPGHAAISNLGQFFGFGARGAYQGSRLLDENNGETAPQDESHKICVK
jgi:hypothetical protein